MKHKNKKPELTQTVKPILEWAKKQDWLLFQVESRATYNVERQAYLSSNAPVGCPDLLGTLPNGTSVYIECKALGKLKTVRSDQLSFLEAAIDRQAFAVAVDSLDRLKKILLHYSFLKDPVSRKEYLRSLLPEKKETKFQESSLDLNF